MTPSQPERSPRQPDLRDPRWEPDIRSSGVTDKRFVCHHVFDSGRILS